MDGLSCFAGALRVAAHNLDTVGVDLAVVVELEVDVLDDESPDVVAEAVCIKMSLSKLSVYAGVKGSSWTDLESQARLDLVGEHVGNGLVEVCEDSHGELRLDAALCDERVERVCECAADTAFVSQSTHQAGVGEHTCFGGTARSIWTLRWPWRRLRGVGGWRLVDG